MTKISRLLHAELSMLIGEIKQYYINYIFYNLSIIILIYGLTRIVENDGDSKRVLAMILSAVLWQICSSSLSYLCFVIQDEAVMGTLEQIFLTKTSFFEIMFSKIVVNLFFSLLKGILLFLACIALYGENNLIALLSPQNLFMIFIIFLVTGFTFYAIGAIFGGVALYYKRIGSVLTVLDNFLLLFTGTFSRLSLYPATIQYLIRLIPLTNANILIYGICYASVQNKDIFLFIATAVGWVLFSIISIYFLTQKAKRHGKLGQY